MGSNLGKEWGRSGTNNRAGYLSASGYDSTDFHSSLSMLFQESSVWRMLACKSILDRKNFQSRPYVYYVITGVHGTRI